MALSIDEGVSLLDIYALSHGHPLLSDSERRFLQSGGCPAEIA
jgi:hypothetical protein